MQTVACDISGRMTKASRALRGEKYFCLTCHQPVRRRKGLFRTPHFYHITQDTLCDPRKRSLLHRQIQDFIQQQFPDDPIQLEVPFPKIGRVADIVCPSRKLIFEVQCSPISRWEVQGRMEDYSEVGYQVVWVLLADRFYRRKPTEIEKLLIGSPYFFITPQLECFVDPLKNLHTKRPFSPRKQKVFFHPFNPKNLLYRSSGFTWFSPSIIKWLYYRFLIKQAGQ